MVKWKVKLSALFLEIGNGPNCGKANQQAPQNTATKQ